jgi:heterodisulfide reductase subunit C
MGNLCKLLKDDIRFQEAMKTCMNCGTCTAICPAAEFYDYDPRKICDIVQRENEEEIDNLLRNDGIWYCGQCMSCKTRCPRSNVPGLLISVLRKVSQELGYFTESAKGIQQFALAKAVGSNIKEIGYCVHPDRIDYELHPEQGPIWKWYKENIEDIAPKLGANYHGDGPGALRTIRKETMEEVNKIFEITGGNELLKKIETYSKNKTGIKDGDELFRRVYTGQAE